MLQAFPDAGRDKIFYDPETKGEKIFLPTLKNRKKWTRKKNVETLIHFGKNWYTYENVMTIHAPVKKGSEDKKFNKAVKKRVPPLSLLTSRALTDAC